MAGPKGKRRGKLDLFVGVAVMAVGLALLAFGVLFRTPPADVYAVAADYALPFGVIAIGAALFSGRFSLNLSLDVPP